MMLSTGVTATSRMLPVFTNATMSMGDVTTELPSLLLVLAHGGTENMNKTGFIIGSLLLKLPSIIFYLDKNLKS